MVLGGCRSFLLLVTTRASLLTVLLGSRKITPNPKDSPLSRDTNLDSVSHGSLQTVLFLENSDLRP